MTFPFLKFSNPILHEITRARDADPAVRATAPLFAKLIELDGLPVLLKALAKATPVVVPGIAQKAGLYLIPPPEKGHHFGCVVALDRNKILCGWVANSIPAPLAVDGAKQPDNFAEAFDSLKSTAARTDFIHRTISVAAAGGHLEKCRQVASEAERYATSGLFVTLLTADAPLLFAAVLVADGQPQSNAALVFTGSVR